LDFRHLFGYFFRSGIVKHRQIGKKVPGCKETNIGDLQSELKALPTLFCVWHYRVKIEFFLWIASWTRYNPDVAECLFDRHI
jgi:hypothetical protein